jgi:hypothetical protein
MAPSDALNRRYGALKLPDLYITHDVLAELDIDYERNFTLVVTFSKPSPRNVHEVIHPTTDLTQDKENDNEIKGNTDTSRA